MYKIDKRIHRIEKKYGRVQKSNFVLAYWIHKGSYFANIHRGKTDKSKNDICIYKKIYNLKHKCVDVMIESNMNTIKICKPDEDEYKWLIVLSNNLEGLGYNIVAPYQRFKEKVNLDTLQETKYNKDAIYFNGKQVSDKIYKKYHIKLKHSLENMEKSRVKMIEKLNK